ncbi:pentatricopeptide repeat-containing protein At4g02750 [Selaginella moellendorffii]|nr:pentatricopeptide repeat-containing protein At4g02750 [Selaginella moellendorffii]|eukprot:XP_002982033.2 pentatricopeptide repeat-containing protein At4g02750 [Selaginella moellendorffii]
MPERDLASWNAIVVANHRHGTTNEVKALIEQMPNPSSVLWTLVAAHAQQGDLDEARRVFHKISRPDAYCWNVMLAAYVNGARGACAIELFREMDLEGVKQEEGSYLHVLTACSHAGMVEDGVRYFVSMAEDYGLRPEKEHFGAMIDLLGRTGRLKEAEDVARDMPSPASEVVWGILLGACKTHDDFERGTRAGERALHSTSSTITSSYVLLSNICSSL